MASFLLNVSITDTNTTDVSRELFFLIFNHWLYVMLTAINFHI